MAAVVKQAAKADGLGQIIDGIKLAEAQIRLVAELTLPEIGVNH